MAAPESAGLEASSKRPAPVERRKQMDEKENQRVCFQCKCSLARSRELIDVAGTCNRWHPECFRCQLCQQPMDKQQTCHVFENKLICRADYQRLKQQQQRHSQSSLGGRVKCARCHWHINPTDWVRRAQEFVYHLACFNCDICQRQLNTGEQFLIDTTGERATARLICRLHFAASIRANPRPVASVESESTPSYRRHSETEPVASCANQQLDCSPRLTPPESLLDAQLRPDRPAGCLQKSAVIMSNAFEFINYQHQQQQQQQNRCTGGSGSTSSPYFCVNPKGTSERAQESELNGATNQPQPRQQCAHSAGSSASSISSLTSANSPSSAHLLAVTGVLGSNQCASLAGSNTSGSLQHQSKSKRVRTTFTEDQLSYLQTQFQRDSNPDGQDLERIATITGLSKRVTQVWFQNSRARQKKYQVKRKPCAGMGAAKMPGSGPVLVGASGAVNPVPGSRMASDCESAMGIDSVDFHRNQNQFHRQHSSSEDSTARCNWHHQGQGRDDDDDEVDEDDDENTAMAIDDDDELSRTPEASCTVVDSDDADSSATC